MLLRTSISTTKKFIRKTLCNFKSFFSNSYHRLPKAAPPIPAGAGPIMDKDSTFHSIPSQKELQNGSFAKNNNIGNNNNNNAVPFSKTIDQTQMEGVEKSIKIGATHQRKTQQNCESSWKSRGEMCLVAKKIKELEKLEGRNVDIEEVLHYYSRLTCPTYLQIVDKFFIEVFAEFCSSSSSRQNCTLKSTGSKSIKDRILESEESSQQIIR